MSCGVWGGPTLQAQLVRSSLGWGSEGLGDNILACGEEFARMAPNPVFQSFGDTSGVLHTFLFLHLISKVPKTLIFFISLYSAAASAKKQLGFLFSFDLLSEKFSFLFRYSHLLFLTVTSTLYSECDVR